MDRRRPRAAACRTAFVRVLRELGDPRLVAWGSVIGLGALIGFGTVSAIIPNPVFGRSIPPEPFAIAVWLVSAPLAGLIAATYVVPPVGNNPPVFVVETSSLPAADTARRTADGTTLGSVGGLAAFLAIGCPLCNKIALMLLGTSGALSVFAPIQPLIGAASVILLAVAFAWRLHLRASGGACSRPAAAEIR